MILLHGSLLLFTVVCLVTSLPQSLPSLPEAPILQQELLLPAVPEAPIPQPDLPLPSVPEAPVPQPDLPLPSLPEASVPQPDIPLTPILGESFPQPDLPLASLPEASLPELDSVPKPSPSLTTLPQSSTTTTTTTTTKKSPPKRPVKNCISIPRVPNPGNNNGLPHIDEQLQDVKDVKRGLLDNPLLAVLKKLLFGKSLPLDVDPLSLLPSPKLPELPISNALDALSLPKPNIPLIGGSRPKLPSLPFSGGKDDTNLASDKVSKLIGALKLLGLVREVGDKMIVSSGKEESIEAIKNSCKLVGGRIVAPMNEAENNAVAFFTKKYNQYAYLGLVESPVVGVFQYYNGLPAVYTKWRKNEPGGRGKERCVEMYTDGQWNDKGCNQYRLAVCEL